MTTSGGRFLSKRELNSSANNSVAGDSNSSDSLNVGLGNALVACI
jgi:hypothetical protein